MNRKNSRRLNWLDKPYRRQRLDKIEIALAILSLLPLILLLITVLLLNGCTTLDWQCQTDLTPNWPALHVAINTTRIQAPAGMVEHVSLFCHAPF